ncbi:MAG: sulfur carrier protein ThiS adenylyltransferase ThiF [Candidatus Cloacimonadales bacterium]
MKKDNFNPKNIYCRNVAGSAEILQQKTVGIAGCGGLGSNIAIALARSGVGNMILVDYDLVELSNLNRQYFFLQDVGELKALALANHIKKINPRINLEVHICKLRATDVKKIFGDVDLLLEAFDKAESKKWLIESWMKLQPNKPIICGSGISGLGKTAALRVEKSGNIIMCGDQRSEMSQGLAAPRVAIVANMQANEAVEYLVGEKR